jgi:hypothetical protein
MRVQVYIDSDTCLNFQTMASAFAYIDRNGISCFLILRFRENSKTVRIYNPYTKPQGYDVANENEALKHVGSFLF